MIKILFVCHGNICRSPMAEFFFRSLVEQAGKQAFFEVASAATSTEEIGNPVYPQARRKLAEHGIGCAGKTARQMTADDYMTYDWLIGMDEANIRNMRRICGGDPKDKIRLLLSWAGRADAVADPWYTRDFEAAWQDITQGCRALFQTLCGEDCDKKSKYYYNLSF
nr:low molecular weight protein-tyrosine-phosphatase [uncultured Butyricicoccus sp.]